MNDSELESRLRTARTPERSEDYWDAFPQRVMAKLPRHRVEAPMKDSWLAPAAWGGALAFACLMIGFGIGQSDRQFAVNFLRPEQDFRRELTGAPRQLCAMIQSDCRLPNLAGDTP